MHRNCAIKAMMEDMPWYFSVLSGEIPICAKMVGEKYWMAETP